MQTKAPITVAYGDGIGPEIMKATLFVLQEAGANIEIHPVEIGEKIYLQGNPTGIEARTWDTILNTKAFLKAPITTPQGGGFKSLNVTIRTALGLYANVRPCVSYFPYIFTKHPKMNVVIVRENEEDLYLGIEYRQTPQACESLKIISRPGSEKIIRYAFEYARHYGRKKVTCFTKDNIMKFSDGLFHKVFDEISQHYPEIEKEHWIVDIGAAKLADTPELFDVVVMPNLYGDILSDVAAQISGSVGIAGSANIGDKGAMFEAIHGSAPRRAGQDVANPSGLLLASVSMLVHLGQIEIAERIHNAWLKTIEEGIHTYDIYTEKVSKRKVGTKEFGQSVVKFLGEKPTQLGVANYHSHKNVISLHQEKIEIFQRELIGVDVFVYFPDSEKALIPKVLSISSSKFSLELISNRGVRVWPEGIPVTFCIDQFRCRFVAKNKKSPVSSQEIITLLQEIAQKGFDIIKTENLYLFDGKPGYSSAEG